MGTLNDFTYVDGVHDVLALYVNKLVASSLRGELCNVQTISAALALDDASLPTQSLTASGANQDVKLAPEAATNHLQVIHNAGSTYSLVVKDDSGTTTFVTLIPGQVGMFIPINGTVWKLFSLVDAASDGKYYARNNGAWASFVPGDRGFIDGLKLTWVSATAIDIGIGAAYIESLDRVERVTSVIHKTGLSLSASTWYHVYLYDSSGTPTVEVVTTAPASPYFGMARSKTSDTTRRYLGSIKTDASGNIYEFVHELPGGMYYVNVSSAAAPFRCLSGGTATVATAVALSGVIPATAILARLRFFNSANQYMFTNNSNAVSSTIYFVGVVPNLPIQQHALHPMDASQQVWYLFGAAVGSGSGYIDVLGYVFER